MYLYFQFPTSSNDLLIFKNFLKKIFFNVYLVLRQRQSMSRVGAEREGDIESETGSWLWAVSTEPYADLEPMNSEIVTWAEVRRPTDWDTQAPRIFLWKQHVFIVKNKVGSNKSKKWHMLIVLLLSDSMIKIFCFITGYGSMSSNYFDWK